MKRNYYTFNKNYSNKRYDNPAYTWKGVRRTLLNLSEHKKVSPNENEQWLFKKWEELGMFDSREYIRDKEQFVFGMHIRPIVNTFYRYIVDFEIEMPEELRNVKESFCNKNGYILLKVKPYSDEQLFKVIEVIKEIRNSKPLPDQELVTD